MGVHGDGDALGVFEFDLRLFNRIVRLALRRLVLLLDGREFVGGAFGYKGWDREVTEGTPISTRRTVTSSWGREEPRRDVFGVRFGLRFELFAEVRRPAPLSALAAEAALLG
jgi:hypothetical protein